MEFNKYKKVLVLAVGGGNDSVSTLLLQLQLNKKFGYSPDTIDIVAVLPDCLDYQNLTPTSHCLIGIINESTTRSVQGYVMNAFPERILAQNKNIIVTRDQIFDRVWGIDSDTTINVVNIYLNNLRRKLEAVGQNDLIKTLRNIGFILEVSDA